MAGQFSEAIQELKLTANIVDVISEYVSLRRRGRNYVGLCPFHAERTPSFTVSEERQAFHCFGCGAGGDVFTFLMKFHNLSFMEAARELARKYGFNLPEAPGDDQSRRERILALNERAAAYYHRFLKELPPEAPASSYLRKRGIKPETIERFRLGYAPDGWDNLVRVIQAAGVDLALAKEAGLVSQKGERWYDRFRGRIIFPIRDLSGRVVGFGGRILGQREPKYLNTSETPVYHKGRLLYGLFEARLALREEGAGLVVEGYLDLLSLSQAGITNVVATLGTALTREHVRLLKGYTKNWYLIFDADPAGLKAIFRAAPLFLNENLFPRVVLLPEGEDPDSFIRQRGQEGLLELLDQARPIFSFLIDQTLKTYGGRGPEAKVAVVEELRPLLASLIDPIKQDICIEELAERLSVRKDHIYRALESSGRSSASSSRQEGFDPFGEALLAFLVNHPQYFPEFADLSPEEFLRDEYRHLFEAIKQTYSSEGQFPEALFFEDEKLSALWARLRLSLEEEDRPDPEVMAQELRRSLDRLRKKQALQRLLEEIRLAQKEGHQELALQLLKQYQGLCLQQAG